MDEIYWYRTQLAIMALCFVVSVIACVAITVFGATGSAGPLWMFVGGFGAATILAGAKLVAYKTR